jgi:hypothetical protein
MMLSVKARLRKVVFLLTHPERGLAPHPSGTWQEDMLESSPKNLALKRTEALQL